MCEKKTPRENEMMKLRLQNPAPITRLDDLALSRRQGRDMRTIQRWKSNMKNYRNENPPQIKKSFKDICKDPVSDKRKGCGIYCEVTETYLLCPSCQKFVWHKSCLESICKEFKMSVPNLNSAKWKCPNFI